MRSHEWIEQRSAALHDAVAAKLEASPALLDIARANLSRWLSANPSPPLLEWQRALERLTIPELVALLRATTPRAVWLRQSSPFAGVLTPEERAGIMRRYDPRRA